MKLIVNLDVCESNGLCVGAAPEVFDLDADDHLTVRHDQVRAERRRALEEAVRLCPRAALRLEEDP